MLITLRVYVVMDTTGKHYLLVLDVCDVIVGGDGFRYQDE